MVKKIVLAADHGGYALKEKIKEMLKKAHYKIEDVGTFSTEPCDYPLFGFNAAKEVSKGKANRAIVICKTGAGMSIIANKCLGVRASACNSVNDALSSRKHNDTNVLVLAAMKLNSGKAMNIVKAWLRTKALKGRHARRVRQIKAFEKKTFKKRNKT